MQLRLLHLSFWRISKKFLGVSDLIIDNISVVEDNLKTK
jgi:hypothetical protein